MSQTNSPSPASFEQVLAEMHRLSEDGDAKKLAIVIEAHQAYVEYLDELFDDDSPETSVVVDIDGKRIRFPNEQALADFLVEMT